MIVTIIVFTLVTGSITTVVIASLKHQNSLADRGSALAAARNALEQVDRDIRSANPLCVASASEVVMLETPQTPLGTPASIVDYKIVGNQLWYYQYSTNPTAPPPQPGVTPVMCNQPVFVGGVGGTVPVYESAVPTASRVILNNVVNTSAAVFTLPPTNTTFDNCPTGGVAPTSATPVNKITALTATISLEPPTLKSPVTATDCGTYLRNSAVPTT
jgi:hypothetical protein